jgi:hypothetical protein
MDFSTDSEGSADSLGEVHMACHTEDECALA